MAHLSLWDDWVVLNWCHAGGEITGATTLGSPVTEMQRSEVPASLRVVAAIYPCCLIILGVALYPLHIGDYLHQWAGNPALNQPNGMIVLNYLWLCDQFRMPKENLKLSMAGSFGEFWRWRSAAKYSMFRSKYVWEIYHQNLQTSLQIRNWQTHINNDTKINLVCCAFPSRRDFVVRSEVNSWAEGKNFLIGTSITTPGDTGPGSCNDRDASGWFCTSAIANIGRKPLPSSTVFFPEVCCDMLRFIFAFAGSFVGTMNMVKEWTWRLVHVSPIPCSY